MMDISAKNLSFSYGGTKVIDSLDLELFPGKLTFLLGANGSGKSTLLKLLSGLLKPKSGKVLLGEKELHTLLLSYRSKHLGVMLQQHGPALDFTAEEFVMFGRTSKLPRLSGPGEADKEAVKNALELLRMESFSGRPANRLSGGEFQRLCIASVLALDSEILFFDEPVSAQDPAQAAMIFETLKELAKKKNILIISHDLDLAARCGERILLLAAGKIFADGTPDKVLTGENLEHLYQLPGYTAIESRSFGFCRKS